MHNNVKKVLILEDDQSLVDSLKTILNKKYVLEIDAADNIDQAIDLVDHNAYELLIVDWFLPNDESGLEVIRYVHEYHYQLKVLMLTHQSANPARLKATKTGADAYLSKPFNKQEVVAKVGQLLNTYKLKENAGIRFENLILYPNAGKIIVDNEVVPIRSRELDVLQVLVTHSPNILSKQKIIDLVWSDTLKEPGENTLEVYIHRLRKRLGKYRPYLKNKRGFGYFFAKGNEQQTDEP